MHANAHTQTLSFESAVLTLALEVFIVHQSNLAIALVSAGATWQREGEEGGGVRGVTSRKSLNNQCVPYILCARALCCLICWLLYIVYAFSKHGICGRDFSAVYSVQLYAIASATLFKIRIQNTDLYQYLD